MFRLKITLQHILNPLHVYCRLSPVLGRRRAMAIAHFYESCSKKVIQQGIRLPPQYREGLFPDDQGRMPDKGM